MRSNRFIARRKVQNWLNNVPATEKGLPLFVIDRKGGQIAITADQAMERTRRRASIIGQRFAAAYSGDSVPPSPKYIDLVLLRCQRQLQMTSPADRDKPVIANYLGDSFSRADIVREIRDNTDKGCEMRRMYERYIRWLMKRYQEA